MNIFINGSPRIYESNTDVFLIDAKNQEDRIYYLYKDNFEDIINKIYESDNVILAFPLYVDSPTSKTLEFFEYISENRINLSNKNLYVIINCGFLEYEHNETALRIVKCFCKNNGINYKGSFLIGAGEIIGKKNDILINKLVSFPYDLKIKDFKNKINQNQNVDIRFTVPLLSKSLFILIANYYWKDKIKEKQS